MLLKCYVEIESIVSFVESNTNKRMLAFIVLDPKNEITTAIKSFLIK